MFYSKLCYGEACYNGGRCVYAENIFLHESHFLQNVMMYTLLQVTGRLLRTAMLSYVCLTLATVLLSLSL